MVTVRPRVLIFGAGSAGGRALRHYRRRCRVVGFVDNDPLKWGRRFLGRPVLPPDRLGELEWERIVVASIRCDQIVAQLLKMEIPARRIEVVPSELLSENVGAPWGCLGLIVAALALLAGAIHLL